MIQLYLSVNGVKLKKVLVTSATPNPFSEDHGGKQRLVSLVRSLSKRYKVTVLSLSWAGEDYKKEISSNINHIVIPVERNIVRIAKAKDHGVKLFNPNQDILIEVYKKHFKRYKAELNTLSKAHDIIVVDHYATAPMIEGLTNTNIPIFYSSQNCETDLAKQLYPTDTEDINITHEIERNILQYCTAFSYCSTDDLEKINKYFKLNKKSFYIPNGTDLQKDIEPGDGISSKDILFIGSGHPPNQKAAKKVLEIAAVTPEYNFVIAGSCAYGIAKETMTDNVRVVNPVSNDEVEKLFYKSFAFINPMMTGSGTHLKMMKALSYGLPIISSDIGARGFSDKEKDKSMIIANDIESMQKAILSLSNKKTYMSLSAGSLELAKEYDWNKIGEDFADAIESVIGKDTLDGQEPVRSFIKDKEKILIYSIVRNEKRYIDNYYDKLREIVQSFPQYEFYLSIYENDSDDGTREKILSKDWSFFPSVSIISEKINTKHFGSTKDEERVKNLSIARNKAIEAGGFLDKVDYVMMVEGDVDFNMSTVKKILNFKYLEPDFDIVSGITIRANWLYDQWATRKGPEYNPNTPALDSNYKDIPYDKYYSTSNGICLYRAQPFKEGIRHGYINAVTKQADCEMVVLCQNFSNAGYGDIYIIHDAEIYHEHR
jgi:glycosyltransferase involved in cell wall biosynthesis